MRVGIMTWFHYRNYGTALQVTALSKAVSKLGHQPYIINYIPKGREITLSSGGYRAGFDKFIMKVKYKLNKVYEGEKRENKFTEFHSKHLQFTNFCKSLSDLENLNEKLDAFICGSDQIWAPICFNSHYFLDFVKESDRMIAYAPSVGLPKIKDALVAERIKELAARFDNISTREENGSKIIGNLIGKNVQTVLDPTFLLDSNEWSQMSVETDISDEPYVIAYFLGNNSSHWSNTYKIAKKLGMPVKVIPVFEKDFKRDGCITEPLGPAEFLSYIKNASYVCTDSFHGTAFAINFNKNFCVFERFKDKDPINQNSRIYNILDLLDLREHLFTGSFDKVIASVDYSKTNKKLDKMKSKSTTFLKSSLDNAQSAVNKKTKNHIYKTNSLCCGCGACAASCPVGAIDIKRNEKGFYTAAVDEQKCISCGKCRAVCPFNGTVQSKKAEECSLYSYKSGSGEVLLKSSSGGIAYELASMLLSEGYSAVGCAFDVHNQQAEHIIVKGDNAAELYRLQGSKYMQSEFAPVMKHLKECENPMVIFATPCQIAGARKFLSDRDDIIYVDLICHGVPSYCLYQKYSRHLSDNYGINSQMLNVSFRYKPKGWRKIYMYSEDNKTDVCFHQSKDYYFRMFEGGHCYSEACYECRWRDSSTADIRIGDYWGERFKKDKTGVSMVMAVTEAGEQLIEKLKEYGSADIKSQSIAEYFCQQTQNNPKPVFYDKLISDLKNDDIDFSYIIKNYAKQFETERRLAKIFFKVKRLLTK